MWDMLQLADWQQLSLVCAFPWNQKSWPWMRHISVQHLAWHHTNTGRINACAFFLQCSTHAWARGRVSVLYGKNVCTSSVGSRKQCWVESCIWSVGTCAVNRPLSTSHSLFHPVLFLWLPYLLPAKQTPSLLLTISSLIPTGVGLPLAAEAYLQRKKKLGNGIR